MSQQSDPVDDHAFDDVVDGVVLGDHHEAHLEDEAVTDTPAGATAGRFDPRQASARRWMALVTGISMLVPGVALSIVAGVGVGSWQVFETGLASATGAPLGWVLVLESLAVLAVVWGWLGVVPGPGTVVLALVGGPVIGWLTGIVPPPASTLGAWTMFGASCAMIGFGISLYVPAELGPSAQDALFVGLYRRFRWRPGLAKFATDASLVLGGWWLGGQVGLGTVVVTLAIPPIIEFAMPHGHRLAGTADVEVSPA